jgi:hypothetical protein
LSIRLPEALIARLAHEAKARQVTTSDIVRERLTREPTGDASTDPLASIADLIGSVKGTPPDLSSQKKQYLKDSGYGRKRAR